MLKDTFDPSESGPSAEQQAAEASALQQGQMLEDAANRERDAKYAEIDAQNNSEQGLIDGKFKTQEDLLKAYHELQKKMSSGEKPEEEAEESEEEVEATEEEAPAEEESSETVNYMMELGKEFDENGSISEEAIDKLAGMDTRELVKSYLEYQAKATAQAKAASMQQSQVDEIMQSVGGAEKYSEMLGWAAQNLSAEEIADFNAVTNTNNPVAIKFAVDSLSRRYRSVEGYEAPLVTGRKSSSSAPKGYRSQAELARDISDPRYKNDPAFRQDVEAKLARSGSLL